jgi:hypothetical protein
VIYFLIALNALSVAAIGLWTVKGGGMRFFHPILFVLIGWLAIYVVQPLDTYRGLVNGFGRGKIVYAFLAVLVALWTFAAAYFLGARSRAGVLQHLARRTWLPGRLCDFGILLIALGVLGQIWFIWLSGGAAKFFSVARGAGAYETTTAYLYGAKWWVLTGLAFVFLDYRNRRTGRAQILLGALGVTGIYLLYQFFVGQRSGLIMLAALCLLIYFLPRRRKPDIVKLGACFILVAFVLGFVGRFRHDIYYGSSFGELQSFGVSDVPQLIVGSTGSAAAEGRYTEHCEIAMTVKICSLFPERLPFDYGLRYLNVFIQWIPRLLWPERPYLGLTLTPEQLAVVGREFKRGPSSGFVGSFWANGGWLGVLVAAAVHGYVLGMLWKLFTLSNRRSVGLAVFVLFFDVGWEWVLASGGAYLTIISRGPWRIAPLIVVWLFLSRKAEAPETRPGLPEPAAAGSPPPGPRRTLPANVPGGRHDA